MGRRRGGAAAPPPPRGEGRGARPAPRPPRGSPGVLVWDPPPQAAKGPPDAGPPPPGGEGGRPHPPRRHPHRYHSRRITLATRGLSTWGRILLCPAVIWPFRVLPPGTGARGLNPERISAAPAPMEYYPPARREAVQQKQRHRRQTTSMLPLRRPSLTPPIPKGWTGRFTVPYGPQLALDHSVLTRDQPRLAPHIP